MFYCKAGNLLIIKPALEERVDKFCRHFDGVPYTWALEAGTHKHVNIPEEKIVMALEGSVAPFYWSDMVRCLWGEKIFHIRRVDLQHLTEEKCKN